eukprot:752666-Hanusia_phi.AAC.2
MCAAIIRLSNILGPHPLPSWGLAAGCGPARCRPAGLRHRASGRVTAPQRPKGSVTGAAAGRRRPLPGPGPEAGLPAGRRDTAPRALIKLCSARVLCEIRSDRQIPGIAA